MEEIRNHTFATFCDVLSFVIITSQYLEHSWVVKTLILIFLRQNPSNIPNINKQFKDTTHKSVVHMACGQTWAGT